jgi:hypothetical protein
MPKKARSKSQFRFLQGIAHGNIKGDGLSKDKAAEMVEGQSPKGLPEKAAMKKHGKMHKKMHKWAEKIKG